MKDFILDRLKDDSTYVGVFLVVGAFLGLELTEYQKDAIMFLGMALVAAPEGNLRRVIGRMQSSKKK